MLYSEKAAHLPSLPSIAISARQNAIASLSMSSPDEAVPLGDSIRRHSGRIQEQEDKRGQN